jgi:hypothetical protein
VRFHVLRASMKITVVWDVASCNLVKIGGRFRGAAYCRHHQGDDGGSKHF